MPPRASRIKDLLNAPLATAYARVIVFCSPVALSVLAYAGYNWVNAKISEAPAMVAVTSESADTKRRVAELEILRGLDQQQALREARDLAEVKADVKSVLATVNRMAGAMEVRTGLKLSGEVDTTLVADRP